MSDPSSSEDGVARRLDPLDLPAGPPLHLERPGACARHLAPFIEPRRIARMHDVLGRRVRHLTALVEHVHDPHNVAACARSCDAFGIQDLHVIPEPGADRVRIGRHVSRGTDRWLTIHYHDDTDAAVDALHAAGYRIAATDLGDADAPPVSLTGLDVDAPLCVAFGNEHDGISETLRRRADLRVLIPMVGFVESLNISVAFAVAMSHLRLRRDAAVGAAGDLDQAARIALLDRWIFADVPRARQVLDVVAQRLGAAP
ncbi:MAG: RNA methyltransferase [Deltaproteobacteria bacterium]|nr:MAG: RNA methyltransferase [Deltaproteobacteria bacterium]